MKIIDINGNKTDRNISIPDMAVKFKRINKHVFFAVKNDDDSISIYLYGKDVAVHEAVVMKKGNIVANPALEQYFEDHKSTVFPFTSGGNNLRECYGSLLCCGFNRVIKTDFFYALKSARIFYKIKNRQTFDMDLPDFRKLGNITAFKNLAKHKGDYIMTTAYIQNIGNDEFMVRIFSSIHGEVVECSRIWASKNKSRFLFLFNGHYYESKKPYIQSMDFAICGHDAGYENSWVDNIGKTSIDLCLGLYDRRLEAMMKSELDCIFKCMLSEFEESDSIYEGVKKLFGICNLKGKNFPEMVQIPLKALRVFNLNEDEIHYMSWYGDVFGYKLLASIGSEKLQNIINKVSTCSHRYSRSVFLPLIYNLTREYGIGNIERYMDYLLKEDIPYQTLNLYVDYISLVVACNLSTLGFKWKIKKNRIKDAHDRAVAVSNAVENEALENEYNEKIMERSHELEKYEYLGNKYIVRKPESALDFIKEGETLNHCVKGYIKDAANGVTNILFIRKASSPDKPYFTLEIRDNTLRQCHGFDNSNPPEDLRKFLWAYCREKGVEYQEPSRILAV